MHIIKLSDPLISKNLADIHVKALSDDVLPAFGVRALDYFYKNLIKQEHQSILGCVHENRVIGFAVLSSINSNARSILKNMGAEVDLINLLLSPVKILLGVVQAFNHHPLRSDTIEIAYFAVLPDYQSKGVGSKIIENLIKFIPVEKKFIQTKTSNQRLKRFYINNFNAEVMREYSFFNKKYSVLRWSVQN